MEHMKSILIGVTLALIGSVIVAFPGQAPRFNDQPLRGVGSYSLVAVVAPGLAHFAGLGSADLKSKAESIFAEAGILKSEGKSPVASVFIVIMFTPPSDELHGWRATIEVRERARLERAPDAGSVMAVTWDATRMGLSRKEKLGPVLEDAVEGLVESLVEAHKRGGPATR